MTRGRRVLLLAPSRRCLLGAGAAHAQGPVYYPTAPTAGALYTDGQSGRYLLGGEWLFRADPTDAGLAQHWFSNVSSTDGWSPVTVPNAYNAGNFSVASMQGYVGWYRRDFHAAQRCVREVRERALSAIGSSGSNSVNYRSTVWLNGKQIGSHRLRKRLSPV